MLNRSTLRTLVSIVLLLALALPTTHAAPALQGQGGDQAGLATLTPGGSLDSGLYRTSITVRTGPDWTRLEQLGVVVLKRQDDKATVVVDDEQLESLARLRFQPRASDELGLLLRAQAPSRAWLLDSMQPLLDQGAALQRQLAVAPEAVETKTQRETLRAAMQALTPEQIAAVGDSFSVDDDGDGLTNTEEAWWCTDPWNPNSDGDVQGYTDGQEVAALLDFSLPRGVRWSYGPPFGPPNPWPNFNNQNGSGVNVCNDGDWDTIPDYAEAYVVGTRVGTGNSENTDGDKFDDGQELFGIT